MHIALANLCMRVCVASGVQWRQRSFRTDRSGMPSLPSLDTLGKCLRYCLKLLTNSHDVSHSQPLFGLCNLFMRNSTVIRISHQHLWRLQLDAQLLTVTVDSRFKE